MSLLLNTQGELLIKDVKKAELLNNYRQSLTYNILNYVSHLQCL